MALFRRRRQRGGSDQEAPPGRAERRAEEEEAQRTLVEWVEVRHGVEIFVEPRTSVTGSTMLLVAHDGEFTRRPVPGPTDAQSFARAHNLPIYDATVVGYPQRMRDYTRRQTILRKRANGA